jgi:hypothetical protein
VRHWSEVDFGSVLKGVSECSKITGTELCDEKCLERVSLFRGRRYHTDHIDVEMESDVEMCSGKQAAGILGIRKDVENHALKRKSDISVVCEDQDPKYSRESTAGSHDVQRSKICY